MVAWFNFLCFDWLEILYGMCSSVQLCIQVASKVNDAAGDGTTTAIILAREMIKSGLLAITFGANPSGLRRGMEKTVNGLIKKLKKRSIPVKGRDDIRGKCFSKVLHIYVQLLKCLNINLYEVLVSCSCSFHFCWK